jgi:SNF2 family DNA or RNA helicase
MSTNSTTSEILRSGSREELKRLALRGELTWKGKKVVLDPFTEVDYLYEVSEGYRVRCTVEGEFFPLGVLQHQIFRFWKNDSPEVFPDLLTLEELKKLVDEKVPLVWKCPVPRWKPEPIPFLVLKDRTGAFAELWMDYGSIKLDIQSHQASPEELFWEKDLLETNFIKKLPGYYCPMDKVLKSLTFLLDIGWTILDHQGKKLVRQGVATWTTAAMSDHLLVQGRIKYGDHEADAKNVIGAFTRRERFINLSASEVGLLDFPPAWEPLAEEEIVQEGIKVRKCHVGLLEDIVPIPKEYQPASWEEVEPGSGFQGNLFDYQKKGLQWLSYLYRSGFSGLLADEMGLGKTVQVITFLSTLKTEKPILIVMPVSLLFHWKKEFEKFLPHENRVIFTSYARLRIDRLYFESIDYEVVILDEAQAIKNPETQAAQVCCRLKASFKLAMTGTPVENRYDDLWSLFRFIMPDLLGDRKESPVFERVRKKIRPFTLRRTKSEVDLQLPEKEQQIVWVNLEDDQRNFYEEYLREKRSALVQRVESQGLSSQKMEILELILRLRQICCHPRLVTGEYTGESGKFEAVCNDLEEVIAAGHKVLVYSQFTSVLAMFRQWMGERPYSYLDGQTKDREKEVEAFQTDPLVQVFLISLKAGGVGLNLQAADYVFLYDPWWNTAVEQQAIDRAHRVGRKGRVIARKYLAAETIEEKILKLQTQKAMLSEQLLEFEGELQPVSLEQLYALLG